MKTLPEIKDEVAKKQYNSKWGEIRNLLHMDFAINEVAKRYAEQAIERAYEVATKEATSMSDLELILEIKNELK